MFEAIIHNALLRKEGGAGMSIFSKTVFRVVTVGAQAKPSQAMIINR